MSRYASKVATPTKQMKTTNEAGGEAYKQTPQMALASLALTSVVIDSAYRSGASELVALTSLLDQLEKKGDLKFAAQTALYVRHTHGLRTISHVIAGEIAIRESKVGYPWRKSFLNKIVKRPDDAIEIAAYAKMKLGKDKMLPNALKRGLGDALLRFDEYAISKYNKDGEGMSLVDLVNLVHPRLTKGSQKSGKSGVRKNGKAARLDTHHPIHLLMTGKIKPAMTWENELSEAGQAKDPAKAKAAVWAKLFKEEQLGYMACLMNLRNILEQAPKCVKLACDLLTDETQVKKSLIMPTQFISAAVAVQEMTGGDPENVQLVLNAINKGIEIAMNNVPKFEGRTLVALDASGSMNDKGSFKYTPFAIGSLFASVLYKANAKADFMYFAGEGSYKTFDRDQKLLKLGEDVVRARINGGTNFNAIFDTANKAYDRIVILSDMQAWMATGEWGSSNPAKALAAYRAKHDADPTIYSFDLKSYGTSQFPTNKVAALAGWTDKVFDIMKNLETDRKALVHAIEAVDV